MPQKAGVLALAGLLAAAGVMVAEAGQVRGQMVVSAYVMVTTSITTALLSPGDFQITGGPQNITGLPPTNLTPGPPAATATKANAPAPSLFNNKQQVCANVAISCSSDAPVRINLEGSGESAVSGARCGPAPASARQSFGLCGSPAAQSALVAVTIEY